MKQDDDSPKIKYKTPKKIKWLIGFLVLLLIIAGFWIKTISDLKNVIDMPPYQFTDVGSLVTASGSWLTLDTELGNPLQTAEIECWEDFGHCFIYYGEISQFDGPGSGFLNTSSELYEISRWTPNLIETKPTETSLGCVEYQLRMDRRSETVTLTRSTVDNTGLCDGINNESINLTLGDGLKRIEQARKK